MLSLGTISAALQLEPSNHEIDISGIKTEPKAVAMRPSFKAITRRRTTRFWTDLNKWVKNQERYFNPGNTKLETPISQYLSDRHEY
jgi:hypothetical protein